MGSSDPATIRICGAVPTITSVGDPKRSASYIGTEPGR